MKETHETAYGFVALDVEDLLSDVIQVAKTCFIG